MSNLKYQISFVLSLEEKVRLYVKQHLNDEIYLGLVGKNTGKRNQINDFKIEYALPLPNISNNKDIEVQVTEHWLSILREYTNFQKIKSTTSLRMLGVLHSHPHSIPALSDLDKKFGYQVAQELGNAIMLVIGKRLVLYSYLVEQNTITTIKHVSKRFGKKYTLTPERK